MKKINLSFPTATILCIVLLFNGCKKKELPNLLTSDATEITESSVTSGGVILSDGGDGISAKGICWSTEPDPTIDNNKKLETENLQNYVSRITGLIPNKTYYIRAFAINSVGTGYGSQISFKTLGDVPAVATKPASNVSISGASLNGSVNPNRLLTTISFEYGLTENYGQTITSIPETLTGSSETNVQAALTGLIPNTTYHFRLKAQNEAGISYGNDATITTLAYITDIDGFSYGFVVIGTQTWLKDNLKTSRYRDGSVIPLVPASNLWPNLTTGAYSSYDNNNAYASNYGALYNWYAATDPRGLCPAGWHVPTNDEWSTLVTYLGGLSVSGGKMKETGTQHWLSPNTGASNSSGFTGIGSGFRDFTAIYVGLKQVGYMWSSTEYSPTHGMSRKLFYDFESMSFSANYKQSGFSVRCIKD